MEEVGFHNEAVHPDGDGLVDFSGEDADFAREFFQGADGGIVTGDDGARVELVFERGGDLGEGAIHGLIERLDYEGVVVTVDDERGKEIGLGVDEPVGGGIGDAGFAKGLSGRMRAAMSMGSAFRVSMRRAICEAAL